MELPINHVVQTAIFVGSLLLVKFVIHGFTKSSKNLPWASKRKVTANSNMILTLALLIGVALIWFNELETLAISFVAVAAAMAIATKELIMCFTGSIYKGTSTSFNVGDRIEIAGMRGDVIDRTLLSTKILEVGPGNKTHQYTGRSIVIPNSLFLQSPIINESYLEDFVLHIFSIPLAIDVDWDYSEKLMLKIADEECSQYYKAAQNSIKKIQNKANLELLDMKPRVHLYVNSHKELAMQVRVTVPAKGKGVIEQRVVKRFWLEK